MAGPAPPAARRSRRRAVIRLAVVGPTEFGRACMVAGLAGARGVRAEACADPAGHQGPDPDIALVGDGEGVAAQAGRLAELVRCWPTSKLVVLNADDAAGPKICRRWGVRACLSADADVDQILAAVLLVQADFAIYPAGSTAGVDGPVASARLLGPDRANGTDQGHEPR